MRALPYWPKPLVFLACLLPLLWVASRALFGTLGVNPVETLHHTFGDWTLRFLVLTLLITPLRLLPHCNWLTRMRRMLGMFAFFYASLHVSVYLILDQQLDWPAIWADITGRRYITFGICAYLLMLPLVITSNTAMKQWLGDYWSTLHKLIYLVTALGIVHYFLMVKADIRGPLWYAAVFGLLVILRIRLDGKKVSKIKPVNNGV